MKLRRAKLTALFGAAALVVSAIGSVTVMAEALERQR